MIRARIPVSFVTGFLGSGKTTLVNRLLRDPQLANTVVIVNEFGEIAIDHDLIQTSDDTMIELSNGCLCCTMRGDLITALNDLFARRAAASVPRFTRVLVETTGLARPGPLIQALAVEPTINCCYVLDSVITTVDSLAGDVVVREHAVSAEQIALADRVVVTKLDLVDDRSADARVTALGSAIVALNPAAVVISGDAYHPSPAELFGVTPLEKDGDARIDAWLAERSHANHLSVGRLDRDDDHRAHADGHGHVAGIRSFCLVREAPIPLDAVRLFWDGLAAEAGSDLLRVKGVIAVAEEPDHPAVVQATQHTFHTMEWLDAWPTSDRRTRIVFIARGFDADKAEEILGFAIRIADRTARLRDTAQP